MNERNFEKMHHRLRRILAIALVGLLALVLTLFLQGIWAALVVINLKYSPAIPWAVAVMAFLLWVAWNYANGSWSPRSTSTVRRRYLRASFVPGPVFGWALLAGALSLVALVGYWIVIFQLIKMPGNRLPDFSRYPLITVALVLIMAAVVGAVVEEAGFRGYFQVALEREFRAPLAIMISALVMSPAHGLSQGFVWPTLLWYFFADVMFGVMAYLSKSILPGIVIHCVGLLIFFVLVWPTDQSRRLVNDGGADTWFWIHIGQAIAFTALAIIAFRFLARITPCGVWDDSIKREDLSGDSNQPDA